jgi:hypothetical protein
MTREDLSPQLSSCSVGRGMYVCIGRLGANMFPASLDEVILQLVLAGLREERSQRPCCTCRVLGQPPS